jgi:hypothetical protein
MARDAEQHYATQCMRHSATLCGPWHATSHSWNNEWRWRLLRSQALSIPSDRAATMAQYWLSWKFSWFSYIPCWLRTVMHKLWVVCRSHASGKEFLLARRSSLYHKLGLHPVLSHVLLHLPSQQSLILGSKNEYKWSFFEKVEMSYGQRLYSIYFYCTAFQSSVLNC